MHANASCLKSTGPGEDTVRNYRSVVNKDLWTYVALLGPLPAGRDLWALAIDRSAKKEKDVRESKMPP